MKRMNEYALEVLSRFDAPKAVWMALAFSLAMRCSEGGIDDFDGAHKVIAEEWRILHANGIVPQRPPAPRAVLCRKKGGAS